MESPQKLFPILDRFLLGGLGCGVFGLCILLGAFVYIWQNPPRPQPTATQTLLGLGGLSTVTPASTNTTNTPAFGSPTPTLFSTITPTQAGTLPATPATVIPSPVPQFDTSPPTGKIVFTCFIDQIDQ